MNKSQRIYLDVNNPVNTDKYVKIKLEQDVNTLEFLTMSINTNDVYRDFNADYGILVGRVIANDGIGIRNAKISIFIPLTDEDAEDNEIASIYPYKSPRDKNNDGKRYNLLPRVAKKDPLTNIISPKQPFGSFPIKEELVTNVPFLNVYKKYYKYSAVSNQYGDYMIYGVPVGTQTVHLSVDITDIGEYSMTPASMVKNLGYSENLFTDGGSRIKESSDLNDLPNIETQEISVDVIPFWGDVTNFEIGITRQDFRIRSTLKKTFTIFGSAFTDGYNAMWGSDISDVNNTNPEETYILYNMSRTSSDGKVVETSDENQSIKTKKITKITEKIYYYPPSIKDSEIESGEAFNEMQLLDTSEYSVYKRDGDFVFIINCNRDKVIVNEDGTETPVDNSYIGGLYTTFKGFITLEIDEDTLPMEWTIQSNRVKLKPLRMRLKFPQHAEVGCGLQEETSEEFIENTKAWRNQHYTFEGGKLYSVAQFIGTVYNSSSESVANKWRWRNSAYSVKDRVNLPAQSPRTFSVGQIQVDDADSVTGNTTYQMIGNTSMKNSNAYFFASNWLNLSIYLPQIGWVYDGRSYVSDWRTNKYFTHHNKSPFFTQDNTQKIVGLYYNTKWFGRSDLHYTDFIEVPKDDIIGMSIFDRKGFINTNLSLTNSNNYRNLSNIPAKSLGWNRAAPLGLPRDDDPSSTTPIVLGGDNNYYFYKGHDTADCIEYINLLGLI